MTDTKQCQNGAAAPATYFATAERAKPQELRASVARITDNPLVTATLEVLAARVAVLNQNRQVLAVNHAFLLALGTDDPANVLGLRPGEVLHCTHATDHPSGCGTGKACATCGAAIVIVATQETGGPQERKCVLTTQQNGSKVDHIFVVRCSPFQEEGESLLLISMQDISAEQRHLALERAFLHDLSNMITVFAASTESLIETQSLAGPELLAQAHEAANTLIQEVNVQRLLCTDNAEAFRLGADEVHPTDILNRIQAVFTGHRAATGQSLVVERPQMDSPFRTAAGLLMRVLSNMTLNAFEAGDAGDQVRVGAEATAENVTFYVWNRQTIPQSVSSRVFQRYFSTKTGVGRGVGTFSMKLLGETLLKGQVSLATSEASGTTFRITLPRNPGTA
ncbi:MAG: HAMP domain-containing histidine kinase [Phycisphaerales bacterium]|nr:MAG: HAMP domain-containing histidine kinase [Phycisphaerales bacterium]